VASDETRTAGNEDEARLFGVHADVDVRVQGRMCSKVAERRMVQPAFNERYP